jgi:hypothetical protein
MTSISMNEDLYDSDDETPPPSALRKRNRASMVGHSLVLIIYIRCALRPTDCSWNQHMWLQSSVAGHTGRRST